MTRQATTSRRARAALRVFSSVLALGFAACSSLRVPDLLPPQRVSGDVGVSSKAAGIVVSARPISTLDELQQLFDEDLPRFGLAAVVVTVRNEGAEPLDAGDLSFRLHRGGRSLAPLESGRILKRYYKRKGMRMVSDVAHSSAEEALDRILYRPLPLGPGGSISGLMFFGVESVPKGLWSTGSQLVVKGFPKVEGRRPEMTLALENAGR